MRPSLRYLIAFAATVLTTGVVTAEDLQQQIGTAKQEYEQSKPTDNEAARQTYVEKLAQIADEFVSRFREAGERNDEAMTAIDAELSKHPLPPDSDSKKLTKLLIGKWNSPRHTYIFRPNGKYGVEDGPINSSWRIKGNQLIEGSSRGTIILLNSNYFIYAEDDDVFFHSRVKE
jgi:hypothetical protein